METFKWEDELRKYSDNRIKSGSEFVQNMASGLENGIKLYNQAARIINTLNDNGKHNTLPFVGAVNADRNKNRAKQKEEEERRRRQQQQRQQQNQ